MFSCSILLSIIYRKKIIMNKVYEAAKSIDDFYAKDLLDILDAETEEDSVIMASSMNFPDRIRNYSREKGLKLNNIHLLKSKFSNSPEYSLGIAYNTDDKGNIIIYEIVQIDSINSWNDMYNVVSEHPEYDTPVEINIQNEPVEENSDEEVLDDTDNLPEKVYDDRKDPMDGIDVSSINFAVEDDEDPDVVISKENKTYEKLEDNPVTDEE